MKKKMGNERRMIEALALVCSLHVEILSDNDRSHHLGSVDDLVEEKLRNIDVMKELEEDTPKRHLPEETKVTRRNKSNNKRKRIRDDSDTSNTSKGGVIHGPNPPPPISEELAQVIRGMTNGDQLNLKLVIQRKLFQTDTLSRQNRLQMPRNQISSDNFLNDDEKKKLDQNEGIQVRFIQPNLEEENGLVFKRWKYKNVNCAGYVFNKNWHKGVVQKNGLECGQLVQVWFFRDKDGNPCFAMVNLG
uniref:B3 domain-containing protein n=1 Tax=Cannabis sativa TaxID=3483 RepID=A0A803P5X6_CANSA